MELQTYVMSQTVKEHVIVIELRKDVNPQVMLNNLFKLTQLQVSYGN